MTREATRFTFSRVTPFDADQTTFTTQELLACIPGLTHATFKKWLRSEALLLSVGRDIGKGRRPKYRISDVVQVACAFELSRQGILVSKFALIRQIVQGRLTAIESGMAQMSGGPVAYAFWAHPVTGELMGCGFEETAEDDQIQLPAVFVLFRVDQFILGLFERMRRVKAGEPAISPDDPFYQIAPKFFGHDRAFYEQMGAIDTDEQGREKLRGLTYEETAQYFRLVDLDLADRTSDGPGTYASPEEEERCEARRQELYHKHERARRLHLAQRSDERK